MKREDRPASSLLRTYRPKGAPTERSLKVLRLQREEGLTRAAIAERMGMSLDAVDRALGEARSAERGR